MELQVASPPLAKAKSARVISVDVLRGIVMFTMVFVNDAYGAHRLPWWMKHFKEDGNGMTFVDVVFPAFLFIVGLSIPVAIENRRAKGDSWLRIYGHAILRTLSLLAIGVLMVNEAPSGKYLHWPAGLWQVLMFGGVILAFHSVRLTRPALRYTSLGLRIAGGLLLIFLAIMFRDNHGNILQPSWWGILGLIGWAYITATTAYLLLRREGQAALVGMAAVLMAMYYADHAGTFNAIQKWHFWIHGHKIAPLSVIGFGDMIGSQAAVAMAGVVIGSMLLPRTEQQSPGAKIRFAFVFAMLMVLAALLTYRSFGINKDNATPSWCFWSIAFTTLLWIGLYAIIDVAGIRAWSIPIAWAGASALMIYILSEGWDVLNEHFVNWPWYDHLGDSYPNAVYHKLITAAGLSLIAGVLGRIGFKLKL